MRTFIGIVVTFFIFFILIFMTKFVYVVPENHYSILDQTGKVKLEDYPELKDISFEYNADLSVEYTEPINLELEKINFRFNDEVIGTAEINKNLNELEDFAKPYNETFIIKRDNISIYYESAGLKLFLPSV